MINARERQLRQYKNNFSIKFAEIMSKERFEWKKIQKQERWSLVGIKSILAYIGFSLLAYLPGRNEHHYDLKFHFYCSIGFFIYAIIQNIYITNKRYQNKIKKTAFPQLVKIFGEDINYRKARTKSLEAVLFDGGVPTDLGVDIDDYLEMFVTGEYYSVVCIPNKVFDSCQLYDGSEINKRTDDDVFSGTYNGVNFIIDETEFGRVTGSGRNRSYNRMFKGVAMHFKMNKVVKNRVLILSKGLFNKVPKGYEKVDVEYNKFSAKYNVYVNGGDKAGAQIEARYLLNTAFLDRFMQLHTSFAIPQMQCSVYGQNMLIMLSTRKDLFEMNHLFGKIDDIRQYNKLFDEFASVLSFIDVLKLSSKTKL